MSVLHDVKDVEKVSLVLQRGALLQLPNQSCKVCVALRVLRQVQISTTVGLSRDIRVVRLQSHKKKIIPRFYLRLLDLWPTMRLWNLQQVERSTVFPFVRSHGQIHGRL